jgi:inorganic pyrophosphatase
MTIHLWHDLSAGNETPNVVTVVIEINKGSKNKYEIDKPTGLIKLDRVMHSSQDYPFDYGFIPQTLCDDGDALDVVLLTTYPLFPGVLVDARPVGVVHMVDGGEADEKIIAVPTEDPRWSHVQSLADVNKHTLKEIEHFLLTYKTIQNKKVEVNGIGDVDKAHEAFNNAVKLYNEKFPKN